MTGKTKAAMPGRLSLNALLKHRQITRLAAGGQTLSQRNPYAQINRVRLTYGHRNPLKELDYNESLESAGNKHEQYSGSPEHQHCLGSEVPTNNVESCEDNQPSLRGEPLHNSLKVAQNRPFLRGAVHSITESNPAQPFGSMPCRRNSARASSFNQLPRLTPSRSAASLSCCRNSGVIRIWKVGDSPSPFGVLSRLIVDMYVRNLIAWILLCTYVITTNMQKTTPRTAGTVPGRLTSTDKLRIEEAMKDHITHPQGRKSYIWRFLALSAIGRNVIHITANTEREAREQSPAGCVMVFAGRLPVQEVRYA
ncbi:Uncharacterised protein [Enterobacter hormaechei]|nr:Uncharacterised protein [Enterobacter hormaechei]CZZ93508.1 Uncharacterised protein [Enterobacter hormaechei]SAB70027.1 Uncharacterised protein [Enterobacter hormaechei]SAG62431.1 Uncharacterised protein [Enterobacter hormaechei]